MINISEIVSEWEEVNGWRVSPGMPWCDKGNRVKIGSGVEIGNRVVIGSCAIVPADSEFLHDLGFIDEHRASLCRLGGEYIFCGGCRHWSFADAREYLKGRDDRRMALAAVDYAEALSKIIEDHA